jgi:DNA polymerase V
MFYEQPQGVTIHFGFPNPAADSSLQTLDLNQLLIKNSSSTFFMRIEGNEWASSGIFGGDLIIVDRAPRPRPNDLVIWSEADKFVISPLHTVPKNKPVWGLVTAAIHQYVKGGQRDK